MISLALIVAACVAAFLIPIALCARWLEWEVWDAERRKERLRARGVIR